MPHSGVPASSHHISFRTRLNLTVSHLPSRCNEQKTLRAASCQQPAHRSSKKRVSESPGPRLKKEKTGQASGLFRILLANSSYTASTFAKHRTSGFHQWQVV